MISDAPYDGGELLLRPRSGALAGMLASAAVFQLVSLTGRGDGTALLRRVGHLLSGVQSESYWSLAIGAAALVIAGGVLGLFYAACQQASTPTKGIVVVALYYGLVTWALGGLVIRLANIGTLQPVAHSAKWLTMSLLFTSILCARALAGRSRIARRNLPID